MLPHSSSYDATVLTCSPGVLLLSGGDVLTARYFDVTTGAMRWERPIGSQLLLAPSDSAISSDAVIVLSNGRRVSRLSKATGEVQWVWEFPTDALGLHLFTHVGVRDGKVTVMAKSEDSKTAATHLVLDLEKMLPITDMSFVASLGKHALPYLVKGLDGKQYTVWTEYSRCRVAELKADGTNGPTDDHLPGDGKRFERLIDVGLREDGYMMAEYESGTIAVVAVVGKAGVVAEFPQSAATKDGAPVFSAAKLPNGTGFVFTRVFYSFEQKQMLVQSVIVKPGADAVHSTYPLKFDMANDGAIEYAAVASLDGDQPNLVFVTSTAAIQYHAGAQGVKVSREESLADIVDVRFVDLGEPETEEALEAMVEETFGQRIVRQLGEVKDLPGYLVRFVQRLSDSTSAIVHTAPLAPGKLHRDQFGLQKLLIAVTRAGKVFGLDSANGNIVWSRNLGFFSQTGPELEVQNVFYTRNLSENGNPQIAVIAARTRNDKTVTVGYHVDAFTGYVAGKADPTYSIPDGRELFAGKPKTAFLTPFENCGNANRVVGVVDKDDKVYIFPFCKKMAKKVADMGDRLFYSVLDRQLEGTSLRGYAPVAREDDGSISTAELWARPFPAQLVLGVSPLTPSQTASYGRALGDKSVLYKYMNPHLEVVTTVSPLAARGHVYVIDSTTGSTVYEVEIPNVVGENVHAVMVENWLVYAWSEATPEGGVAGWRLGSVELYEDGDEKSAGRSTLLAIPKLNAISQTFILPAPVRALAFTTSKYGVTTKDVAYLNDKGQVVLLPRRVLDPRRPTEKPTKADNEEGLIPYAPLLPNHPTAVISHEYRLLGLDRLATAPALLESTSLLLAYGLDLFCTRAVQPSGTFDILGDGFNKLQLLVTLGALAVGVAVARPAVERMNLKMKWF